MKLHDFLSAADSALRRNNFAEAERHCLQALKLDRANPQAQYVLAMALSGQGRASEAISLLEATVAQVSDALAPTFELAALLRKAGRWQDAVALSQSFIARNPGYAQMHSLLGICYAEQRRYEDAIHSFRNAVKLEPRSPRYLGHLANALRLSGSKEEAIEALNAALAVNPDRPDFHVALGETLAELGRFDDAITSFEHALRLQPASSWAYLGIATSRRITERDWPLIERIRSLLEQPGLPLSERRNLHYALSKAMDDLGSYKEALSEVDEAVSIAISQPEPAHTSFDVPALEASGELTIRTFTSSYIADRNALGTRSQLPVFIVGAPRSGTTLLDQILTCHPDVGRAGELLYWVDHQEQAKELVEAEDFAARAIAIEYLDLLRTHAPGRPRVTDKMPMNYNALGLIHTLLPEARWIHCRRHPVDNCISLYLNGHAISPKPYGETREEIVAGYKCYLRLMEHWRNTLHAKVFVEVDYEELVSDREPTIRRLLGFLGLNWDDACLHHEANAKQVSTPSRWQARQPIYNSSVERWRRYEPWLGPFKELMER